VTIGVVSLTTRWNGGAFQYEGLLLSALAQVHQRGRHQLEFLLHGGPSGLSWLQSGEMRLKGLPVRLLREPDEEQLRTWAGAIDPQEMPLLEDPARAPALHAADWLFLTCPIELGFRVRRPFVMPIHDLQHRLQPEFPEVSRPAEFARREALYTNACQHAALILVDSVTSQEDVLRCYGDRIDADRIHILPLFPVVAARRVDDPARLAEVRARHRLPERFFFYPAQFWFHKNHVRIIDAIAQIAARTGERMPIAFSGMHGNAEWAPAFETVMRRVHEHGLADCVHLLGFVPEDDMSALYSLAVGLVMPTFFGPSNIPILEAWACGCPTITSDIRGVREQAGDAALLVDPRSVDAIADALWRLWSDPALRSDLAHRGDASLRRLEQTDYASLVGDVVDKVSARVAAGQVPQPAGR
jgi:glycosyltransferase involved in cell wall biosynthesis